MNKITIVCLLCLVMALPTAAQDLTNHNGLLASFWPSVEAFFHECLSAIGEAFAPEQGVAQSSGGAALEEGPSIVPNG